VLGGAGVFLWLVRLVINYQHTIGERYGKEIDRLDAELVAAREVEADLRTQLGVLEEERHELRYLRRASAHAGVFNPWEGGLEGAEERG
jgi:hypothetical protein